MAHMGCARGRPTRRTFLINIYNATVVYRIEEQLAHETVMHGSCSCHVLLLGSCSPLEVTANTFAASTSGCY